jgi:hypothetical protein
VVLAPSGCRRGSDTAGLDVAGPDDSDLQHQYFQYAVSNLQRLDEFTGGEMRQQIVDRPLPEELASLPVVQDLDKLEFHRYDGVALQEAVWLRDVSRWARGDQPDDLSQVKNLFDWTVRNIQLEHVPDPRRYVPAMPWETVLLGRGTATERAWVFILLARQLRIDAVLLGLPTLDPPPSPGVATPGSGSDSAAPLRVWVVAVLIEGKLYLFDLALGVPIPGPDGAKLDEDGNLDVHPATLSQVIADPGLLRQLDLDEEHPYPVQPEQLRGVVALVEASPAYLAARMKMVESHLVGDERIVLTTNPSELIERLETAASLSDTRLWTWPYRARFLRARLGAVVEKRQAAAMLPFEAGRSAPLWKGRSLHLKGRFREQTTGPSAGRPGATHYYQLARPSHNELAAIRAEMIETGDPETGDPETGDPEAGDPEADEAASQRRFAAVLRAKLDASYWLGLVAYERGSYSSSADYFARRVLVVSPGGPWTHGAAYNLARAYEALGQPNKAVKLYESDLRSPAYFGNRLRARWLRPKLPALAPETPGG